MRWSTARTLPPHRHRPSPNYSYRLAAQGITRWYGGALLERLKENVPAGPIEAPLLLGQGEADSLVLPEVQDGYVSARCAAGHAVDYRTYAGLDHVPLVEADSPLIPELVEWTVDRLEGSAPTPNCPE